ncbi:MAG: hypothetical protein ISR76_06095 [Planctomycetes bacterium]|nr:hypothetical protein [Planctomycetota bacterium]
MDEPLPPEDPISPLAPRGSEPSGSLLRGRDVQALNRAFRHLAEVQESLLDRLEAVEEERRRRSRLLLPLALGGGLVLVVALGVQTWLVANQPGPEQMLAALERARPEILVQPTPVTVQAPENAVDAATVEALIRQLEHSRDQEVGFRQMITDLNSRLFEREQDTLSALRELGTLQPPAPKADDAAGAAAAVEAAASLPLLGVRDPWLGALNGLLAVSGYGHFQFDKGARRAGEAVIDQVILLEWGADGLVESILQAEEARLSLHQMSGLLVVELFRGSRSRGGLRAPLPEEGLRLEFAGVDGRPWLEHFPELQDADFSDPAELDRVRGALDGLLSARRPVGYYRLAELGGLEGGTLKWIQLQRYDSAGRLVRTLEADSLEVRLHPSGEVELLLQNGAIHEGGVRRPFYEDRFRVFLPRQPLEAWQASGVPLTELAS